MAGRQLELTTNGDVLFSVRWSLKDPDGNLTPYAITDALLQVREKPGYAPLIEASTANGLIVIDGDWIRVSIPMEVIEQVAVEHPNLEAALYDLVATRAVDDVTRPLFGGQAVIVRGISQ